jgi:AbrB family looped-hinge helix DNA binding protein
MKISERGQITIPKKIRTRYGLGPNTEVEFIPEESGVRIQKRRSGRHPIRDYVGLLGKGKDVDAIIEDMRGR